MENLKKDRIELEVLGMHCQSCATNVNKSLESNGLKDIYVSFSNNEVSFQKDESIDLEIAIKSIKKLGYQVRSPNASHTNKFSWGIKESFILSALFTLPFFIHMIFKFHVLGDPYLQLFLSIPVVIIGYSYFGKSALGSLRVLRPNMDVLIFIGFNAAFIYSCIGILWNLGENFLFFETSSSIITLVLLGNLIEHNSVKKTSSAIAELSKFQNVKANKALIDGKYIELQYNEIAIDDILLVKEGERIPVDGKLVDGFAYVDESMISGESIPIEKRIGDKIIGGTLLVSGNFHMQTEKIGNDTVLSQIIELVKKAISNKPKIQKLGDTISNYFVPAVILISLITFFINYFWVDKTLSQSILNSIAVLVISCPCAMGLATPTAVMVALGRGSKIGILIKGGDTLEKLAKVKTIVIDKTGTLTSGIIKIESLKLFPSTLNFKEEEIKGIIKTLETRSSHPIAQSLILEFNDFNANKKLIDIKEIRGMGMEACDEIGNKYQLGSSRFLEREDYKEYQILLKINDEIIFGIKLGDTLKPESLATINKLKNLGIRSILLSGDSEKRCKLVANELGIQEYYFEKNPQEKVEIIKKLAKEKSIGMVGDGINDAPVLAHADIGISFGNASQIAIQSASIVLLNSDLRNLLSLIHLSKQTLRTIKQNLFWAFFYNVLAIPVAAMGFLSPMLASLSMAFSDVIVIGNSLLLKTKKLESND